MSTRAHTSIRHGLCPRWHTLTLAILLAGSTLQQSCRSRPPTTLASLDAQPAQNTWRSEAMWPSTPSHGCGDQVPVLPATEDAEVVVVEVATDVSAVGRRIWLGEAKNDIWLVTITGETVVRDAHGQPSRLEDVPAGSCIQIGGRAGRPTELIARWIVILDSTVTGTVPESSRTNFCELSAWRGHEEGIWTFTSTIRAKGHA